MEATALTLQETGYGDTQGERARSSSSEPDSQTSHRRRRLLAAHHKDLVGEEPKHDSQDDENCMMAVGRASSEAATSTSNSLQEEEEVPLEGGGPPGPNHTDTVGERLGNTEGEDTEGEAEDTNRDDELRGHLLQGRVLPNPEITAGLGEANNVEVEHYAAGLQRQLTAHIRWLRSNRAHWGSLQQSLIHEFQVAINGGTLLIWMLQQALLFARGLAPPNRPALTDPFPPLSPGEALQRSQALVDEITCH